MTAIVALYSPPEIFRGEQCAEAPLAPAEGPSSHVVVRLAVSWAGRWPHRRAVLAPSAACAIPWKTVRHPAGGRLVMVVPTARMLPCPGRLSAFSVSVRASGVRRNRGLSRRSVPNIRLRAVRAGWRCRRMTASGSASAPDWEESPLPLRTSTWRRRPRDHRRCRRPGFGSSFVSRCHSLSNRLVPLTSVIAALLHKLRTNLSVSS
jgi:hypothetical protein